ETGEFPITVEVSDSEGSTARRDLLLRVVECGTPPEVAEVPWAFEETKASGPLLVETSTLPDAVANEPYSTVLVAAGGVPFRDSRKGPTPPRYWEYSRPTLARAYAEDKVDFGRGGTAIPRIKQYLRDVGEESVVNQTTWWPGRQLKGRKQVTFAGYTQD